MPMSTTNGFAFGSGTVSNTALALTDAPFSFSQENVDAADAVRITCATQPLRYRYDGGTPDASTGHLLAVGSETIIKGNQNIVNLKLIRATGSDGAASITLEKF